jgi:Xaa-Pro aminopeptidase
MLRLENCRERQTRLLRHMEDQELELVVLANPKTIYYFSGVLVNPGLPHVFALKASGQSLLCTNQAPPRSAVDEVCVYTGYTLERPFSRSTMDEELDGMVCQAVNHLPAGAGSVALEYDYIDFRLGEVIRALSPLRPRNITPVLDEMRRRKDPDELECMRATTVLVEAAYGAVKSQLQPGMTEYQAHTIIYEAIVNQAQSSVELRGDFACGQRAIGGGGPPTSQRLRNGELYILDLFPIYQGYVCDLCRTFIVGAPSQLQQDAWAHVMEGHAIAQKLIRPGVPGRLVYHELRAHLDSFAPAKGSFTHHAGHGLGMDAWEFPWLTPGSDQLIQEGEVISCEPGLYAKALEGGIRLEHNYLVGKESVSPLDTFAMDL